MSLPLRKKALLSLAVTLGTLGTAELGLRLFGFQFMPKEVPLIIWNPDEDKQFDSLQALHKMDPECLWTPQPYAAIPWEPGESINSRTYRGPLLEEEPREPPFRVAFLGDSSTFGWGIGHDQTYAARSAAALSESGVLAESLNAGVIGYTVLQGLHRYRSLVRGHKPDVVALAFGAVNDHYQAPGKASDIAKIQKLSSEGTGIGPALGWIRERSRIAHFIDSMRFERSGGEAALRKRYRESRRRDFISLSEVGKREYAGVRRVSLVEYRRYLEELINEIRADGAEPVLLSMPRKLASEAEAPVLLDYSHATEATATRLGVPLVDVRAHFRSFGEIYETALFLDNWHPRPKGHQVIADDLLPLLTSIAKERGRAPTLQEKD